MYAPVQTPVAAVLDTGKVSDTWFRRVVMLAIVLLVLHAVGTWTYAALGPAAGGILTELLGWESIFLAQVPVAVAASVCGVSVDVLAASAANGHASCTATTTSPQLTQAVQQQIASGGSVTGGPQTMGGTPPTNQ